MKKLKVALLMCAMNVAPSLVSAPIEISVQDVKDRVVQMKDALVKKTSAFLVLWNGEDRESQLKRRAFCEWFENKNWWKTNPKRWITWVITRRKLIKNPCNRVTDEEYVQYYIEYKALSLDHEPTMQEKNAFAIEAMEKLHAYRLSRGITQ